MSPGHAMHISIHGQHYPIRTELDAAYIDQLARYVEEKMRMAERDTQSADTLRVAVIAALNIADELFRARADTHGAEGRVLARAADIERLIDAVLATAQKQAIA
jgi:cell division protein ZapA